ncbi:MAG TPA: triose-phosphate isomerase [Noviherbaspirillum sp.]|jgi:triosephosphate isomerase
MRRKLIAGNWKMNGGLSANATLLEGIKSELGNPACAVAVCVPAPYYAQCRDMLRGSSVAWGGQDISIHSSGAYTGEVSGAMLTDFDCSYVIVGHSERRMYHGESDDIVAKKTLSALAVGITPIVCVGESLAEREQGGTNEVVGAQIEAVLSVLDASQVARIVIAYEPVWAIGTGKTATPEMAQEVHAMLRKRLLEKDAAAGEVVQVLYGGSMKPDNARELLSMQDIDGGLIGGASLKASDFLAIVKTVQA